MTSATTVYAARKIITINPTHPTATHIAVRDGRILGVGSLEDLAGWGDYVIDERFADKILMPGLVEGHSHIFEGAVWEFAYTGFFDRTGPDGRLWKGCKSIDDVVERLREAEKELTDPNAALFAWGFDPIYYDGRRMNRQDLDRVSTERPIVVVHASLHIVNANSVVLDRAQISRDTNVHGIKKDKNGEPNGELQEMAPMFMAFNVAGGDIFSAAIRPEAAKRFAQVAQLAGVTTATDLHSELNETIVSMYRSVTSDQSYPLRLVPALGAAGMKPQEGVARMSELIKHNTDKLHFGIVKIMTDGSIQGFTARLRWPGYYNGAPNGIWNMPPEEIPALLEPYHCAGFQLHIHTNGDEAIEVGIDALERVLTDHPRPDHRHTLQHCQMANRADFRRMGVLGVNANLFANHIYYWGDEHYAQTMGPDRASGMDATRSALDAGVPLAIHSDAPVTPIGPLFTAWCAVNRKTASGRILGSRERLTVEEALQMITLGAAYTLKMDHLIGSLEVGKFADFCVLEDDPLAVAPEKLKDIPVWGTVVGGQVFEAPHRKVAQ